MRQRSLFHYDFVEIDAGFLSRTYMGERTITCPVCHDADVACLLSYLKRNILAESTFAEDFLLRKRLPGDLVFIIRRNQHFYLCWFMRRHAVISDGAQCQSVHGFRLLQVESEGNGIVLHP